MILALQQLDVPVVAAIPASAWALGCRSRCHVICGWPASATFGAVFHRVGLSADFGLSWLLPQAVGTAKAMHMLMTAAVLGPKMRGRAAWFMKCIPTQSWSRRRLRCEKLARGPKLAQAMTRRALGRAATSGLGDDARMGKPTARACLARLPMLPKVCSRFPKNDRRTWGE